MAGGSLTNRISMITLENIITHQSLATLVWTIPPQFFEEAVTSRIYKHEYEHMWKNAKVASKTNIPHMQNIIHKKWYHY